MTARTVTVVGIAGDVDDLAPTNGGSATAGNIIVEYEDTDETAVVMTALEAAKAAILRDLG